MWRQIFAALMSLYLENYALCSELRLKINNMHFEIGTFYNLKHLLFVCVYNIN